MLELFNYQFIQKAFVGGTILGIIAPLIGNFLVVKRQSALSDTLSHISLLGVAIGFVINVFPTIIAIIISVASSLFLTHYKGFGIIYKESFLTLLMSFSLAMVAILSKLGNGFENTLFGYLFGSLNAITEANLWLIGIVGIISTILIIRFYRELVLVCFDRDFARIKGVNVFWIESLLAVLTATIISSGIGIFGSMLMTAIVVSPVIIGWSVSTSFKSNIFWSIGIAITAIWASIITSYYLIDLPNNALTVCILCLILVIFKIFQKFQKRTN